MLHKIRGTGGMSYHGRRYLRLNSMVIFCRKHKIDFWKFDDYFAGIPLDIPSEESVISLIASFTGKITTMLGACISRWI